MGKLEGNADLTPAKLVGHHNPARVLREDYSQENFVDGPLRVGEIIARDTFRVIASMNP